MIRLSIKAKEAIKTALAIVLVYAFALSMGWMNPFWGAFAVALIALPTAGQSLQKGLLRLAGTVPGGIGAIIIISVTPQSRWLFLLLVSVWIFFTTYLMLLDKNRSYFWNVAGFVALVIAQVSGSPEDTFDQAVARTIETVLGLTIYMLVTVFIWPRSNLGTIRRTSCDLIGMQAERFKAISATMSDQDATDRLTDLHKQEVQKLAQYAQILGAESWESYEVREVRYLWDQLHVLSKSAMESLDRWQFGLAEFRSIDVEAMISNWRSVNAEIRNRFEEVQRVLSGDPGETEPVPISPVIHRAAFQDLNTLEKSAFALMKKEVESLEILTWRMVDCARSLAGIQANGVTSENMAQTATEGLNMIIPLFDPDNLRGAIFAALSVWAGFLVWVYIDPPGHYGWVILPGVLAMAIAGLPQLRMTWFAAPMAIAVPLGMVVYLLVLPRLSTFLELGVVLFALLFLNNYFCKGIGLLVGNLVIINIISIQNQQIYAFAPLANMALFLFLGFGFVYGLSYFLSSPRPEKALLGLVSRFFQSAENIVSHAAVKSNRQPSLKERWRIAHHRRELRTVPRKLGGWHRVIDRKLFPSNSPEKGQALITSLLNLTYRIEEFQEVTHADQRNIVARGLMDDLETWRWALQKAFAIWSVHPDQRPQEESRQSIEAWFNSFDERITKVVEKLKGSVTAEEGESFYRLLGAYRGVSAAASAYSGIAKGINWEEWREERFS